MIESLRGWTLGMPTCWALKLWHEEKKESFCFGVKTYVVAQNTLNSLANISKAEMYFSGHNMVWRKLGKKGACVKD